MGSGDGSCFRNESIPGPYWCRRSINYHTDYEQTFAGSRAVTKQNKGILCLLDRHIVPMRRMLCATVFHSLPLPTLASFIPVLYSAPASCQLLLFLSKTHSHFIQSITFLKGGWAFATKQNVLDSFHCSPWVTQSPWKDKRVNTFVFHNLNVLFW